MFKELEQVLDSFNINMTITKSGDKVSVSFNPVRKKDNEQYEELVPLIITGTVQELDESLISTVIKPALVKASTTINNIEVFEANLKTVEADKTKKKEIVSKNKEVKKKVAKNDLFATTETKEPTEEIEENDIVDPDDGKPNSIYEKAMEMEVEEQKLIEEFIPELKETPKEVIKPKEEPLELF